MLDYGPNQTRCKNLSAMNDLSNNPLLDLAGLPRFTAIRAEHVEPAVDATLTANRATFERLLEEVREPDLGQLCATD